MSSDEFESGCDWPCFSKPIKENVITKITDKSYGMMRTEVRSKNGNSHLGHVFEDGPTNMGRLRYCFNSFSLKFITKEKMKQEGYGDCLALLD